MHPELKLIDDTEVGAKIAGTEIMMLKDALTRYGEDGFDMEECLGIIYPVFSGEQKVFVEKRIQDSKQVLHRLKDKLEKGITLSQKGLLLVTQGVDVQQAYLPIDKQMQEICEFYNTLDEGFLIQREIDAVDLDIFLKLFENVEVFTLGEKYQRMEDYFRILKGAVEEVCAVWDEL